MQRFVLLGGEFRFNTSRSVYSSWWVLLQTVRKTSCVRCFVDAEGAVWHLINVLKWCPVSQHRCGLKIHVRKKSFQQIPLQHKTWTPWMWCHNCSVFTSGCFMNCKNPVCPYVCSVLVPGRDLNHTHLFPHLDFLDHVSCPPSCFGSESPLRKKWAHQTSTAHLFSLLEATLAAISITRSKLTLTRLQLHCGTCMKKIFTEKKKVWKKKKKKKKEKKRTQKTKTNNLKQVEINNICSSAVNPLFDILSCHQWVLSYNSENWSDSLLN